eukprot:scaffold3582_cov335-Prasinococcus_capsulatus_cf.AAC.5
MPRHADNAARAPAVGRATWPAEGDHPNPRSGWGGEPARYRAASATTCVLRAGVGALRRNDGKELVQSTPAGTSHGSCGLARRGAAGVYAGAARRGAHASGKGSGPAAGSA